METIHDLHAMKQTAASLRDSGASIGFVPTMGALHEGHLSLVKRSIAENSATIVSIFVNPIQFGPREDYAGYPKNLEKDLQVLAPLGTDFVFTPDANAMFPSGFQTRVVVEHLSEPLCGAFRPGHFQGVATVVLKLFHLVMPHRAYFGEKDYQQVQIIRQMARDLNLDVEIRGCPIVREKDGLAMSSRNSYLSPEERKAAGILYAALQAGKSAIQSGEKNAAKICSVMAGKIHEERLASLEYVAVSHPDTLQPLKHVEGKCLLALAVRVGKARLIDNFVVER